jgi:hypothetical protein
MNYISPNIQSNKQQSNKFSTILPKEFIQINQTLYIKEMNLLMIKKLILKCK